MLFVVGAIVVDIVRDDEPIAFAPETETEATVETAVPSVTETYTDPVTETEPAPLPGGPSSDRGALPRSYVVTLHRANRIVPPGNVYFEVLSLELPPGRFEVTGALGLHNHDSKGHFEVTCWLVPSNSDGSPRLQGEYGSDAAFIDLGPFDSPGDQDRMVLFVSQELTRRGKVRLGCVGTGNERGAFTNYASIRALEVGSIETREAPSP